MDFPVHSFPRLFISKTKCRFWQLYLFLFLDLGFRYFSRAELLQNTLVYKVPTYSNSKIYFYFFYLSLPQAFSAFYYIYYFIQQTTGITVTSPKLLEEAAVKICSMSFNEVGPSCANPVDRYSELTLYIFHIRISQIAETNKQILDTLYVHFIYQIYPQLYRQHLHYSNNIVILVNRAQCEINMSNQTEK